MIMPIIVNHIQFFYYSSSYSSTTSKSSFVTPQRGHDQSSGIASNGVPGAIPLSGSPTAGSYIQLQTVHTYFFIFLFFKGLIFCFLFFSDAKIRGFLQVCNRCSLWPDRICLSWARNLPLSVLYVFSLGHRHACVTKKYSRRFDISCSLIRIFAQN